MKTDFRIRIVVDTNPAVGGLGNLTNATQQAGQAAARTSQQISGQLEVSLKSLAKLASAAFAGVSIGKLVQDAAQYGKAIAEVNTLLSDTSQLAKIDAAAKELAGTFGSLPTDQVKGFYQAISSGASDAAAAQEILTAANKLAVGGLTDVTTGVDGLTSILNAYGDKVESATAASDAMFVAMRAGKTTIGELASNIGNVAPLAAQTNTSLDELLAATAALTLGGQSTSVAMTGLRAILASVAKPTKEASDLAAQLGIDFSAAGLETKGFAGFLEDLTKKTGGSTEKLSVLFGGVEALVPILSLTGSASENFSKILEQMGQKAGETETAFNKMADTAQFKFEQIKARLSVLGVEIGEQFINAIVPAISATDQSLDEFSFAIKDVSQALADVLAVGAQVAGFALKTLADYIDLVVAGLAAFAAYKAVFMFAALADAIKKAAIAMQTLNIAFAKNPLGLVATLIATVIGGWVLYERTIGEAKEEQERYNDVLRETEEVLDLVAKAQGRVTKETADQLRTNLLNLEGQLQKVQADAAELYAERPSYKSFWDQITGATDRYQKKRQELLDQELKLSSAIDKTKKALGETETQVKKNEEEEAKRKKLLDDLNNSLGTYTSQTNKALKADNDRLKTVAQLTKELNERLEAERKLLVAEREGAEALKQVNRELEINELIHRKGIELLPEEEALLRKLATALVDVTEERENERKARESAAKFTEFYESVEREIQALQAEIEVLRLGALAVEELAIAKQVLAALEEGSIPWTLEAVSAYYKQLRALQELRKEKEKLAAAQNAWDQLGFLSVDPWGNLDLSNLPAADEVKDTIKDLGRTWKDDFVNVAYDGWERLLFNVAGLTHDSFEDIFEDILRQWAGMLIQMAAQLAAQQFTAAITTKGNSTGSTATGAATAAKGSGASWSVIGQYAAYAFLAWVGYNIFKGFTKKKTPEGEASIGGGSKGNHKIVAEAEAAIRALVEGVKDLAKQWDLGLKELATASVTIGKRGKIWYVKTAIDAVGLAFKSLEEAMDYAAVQALKFAEYSDKTSKLVVAVIRNTRARTTEQLGEDIDVARRIDSFNPNTVQRDIRASTQELDYLRERILALVPASQELTDALNALSAEEVKRWQSLRDQITGRELTPKEELEQRKQRAIQFNAERELRLAELKLKKAELQAQLELLRARAQIVETGGRLGQADLDNDVVYLKAQAEIIKAESSIYAQAIAAIEAQIAAIDAIIANMPDAIDIDTEIKPIRRGGGQREERADFLEQVRDFQSVNLSAPMQGFRDLQKQIADLWEEGKRLKISTEELAKAEAELREQYERSIREQLQPYLDIGKTDFAIGLEQGRKFFQEIRDLPHSSGIPNWLVDLAEGKWLEAQKADLEGRIKEFAGLTNPLDEIRQSANDLRQDVIALGLSSEETSQKLAEIAAAEQYRVQEAQLSLVGKLFSYLKDSTAFEAQRVEYERQRVELEFAIIEAQLRALQIFEKYEAVFNAAKDTALKEATKPRATTRADYAQRQEEAARLQQEAAEKQREAAERFAESTKRLIEFQKSLLVDSSLSTLTPEQRLEEARRQYEANAARALGGDIEAREKIPDVARQYLEIAREFFASSQGYSDIFAGVNNLLSILTGGAALFSPAPVSGGGNGFLGAAPPAAPPPQVTGNLNADPIVNQIWGLRGDLAQSNFQERQGDKELRDKIDRQTASIERLTNTLERLVSLQSNQ